MIINPLFHHKVVNCQVRYIRWIDCSSHIPKLSLKNFYTHWRKLWLLSGQVLGW